MGKKKLLNELEIAMVNCTSLEAILFPLQESYNTALAQYDSLFNEAIERGYSDEIDKLLEASDRRWRNSHALV